VTAGSIQCDVTAGRHEWSGCVIKRKPVFGGLDEQAVSVHPKIRACALRAAMRRPHQIHQALLTQD